MKDIQKVTIGSQVSALEVGLFKDMHNLKEVDFSNVSSIQIPRECFSGCISLSSCMLPFGSRSCEDLTFFDCKSLADVQLPSTAVSAGTSAFCNCRNLTSVAGTAQLTAVANGAFYGCNSLPELSLAEVQHIGDAAFQDCVMLSSIDRFDAASQSSLSVFETVGEYAFANTGLKNARLTLRASADRTWWGEYCFASCNALENVDFLSSCYLGSHMFDHCTRLSNVTFEKGGISYVGKYVFKDCQSLTSLTFPKEQFSFLQGFFDGCSALQRVEFDGYEAGSQFCYVQKGVFNGCTALSTVEFPASLNSLTKIEDAALSNCALLSVTFHGISDAEIGTDDEINERIAKTGFFRLNHDCDIITKSGNVVHWKYRPQDTEAYVQAYEYAADKTTRSDFKTPYDLCNSYKTMEDAHRKGKNPWYYNVKEVVQQAAATGIPVLCFYSYEACTPCQAFKANIYEQAEFQNWVKRQKFLICRIEADKPKAYDKELAYCEDELTTSALNYQRFGDSKKPTDFNAFGDTDAATPYFKGWFMDSGTTNKNLTPPVMVFYYKDTTGNVVAYHDYSLHPLDSYANAQNVGFSGIIQMIKSLCLYHFDNNDLENARYVVDAGKAFDKKDYIIANPYEIPNKSNAISVDNWEGLTSKTPEAVLRHMQDFLSQVSSPSRAYPAYIGGCLFDQIDWIKWSFDTGTLQTADVDTQNDILDRKFIFISGESYKLWLNPDKKTGPMPTPCTDSSMLYEYTLVKTPYTPPN